MAKRSRSFVSGHSLSQRHVKSCGLCRAEKRSRDRMHTIGHYLSFFALIGLVLFIGYAVIFHG